MKYIQYFEAKKRLRQLTDTQRSIFSQIKELYYILEDEGFRTGVSAKHGQESIGLYSIDLEIPDYDDKELVNKKREWIYSQDFYKEFVDRANEICNKFGYRFKHTTGYPFLRQDIFFEVVPLLGLNTLKESLQNHWEKVALDQDFSEYKLKEKSKWESRAKKFGFKFPLFNSFEDFQSKIKSAKVINLDDYRDDIEHLTVCNSIEDIKELVSTYQYPRDVDRIVKGLKSGSKLPMPIVLKGDRGMFIMSGNTRQNVAHVLGIPTQAVLIDLSSRILEMKVDMGRKSHIVNAGLEDIQNTLQEVLDEYKSSNIYNAHHTPNDHWFSLLERGDINNAFRWLGKDAFMGGQIIYYFYYPDQNPFRDVSGHFWRILIKYRKGTIKPFIEFRQNIATFKSRLEDMGYKVIGKYPEWSNSNNAVSKWSGFGSIEILIRKTKKFDEPW